MPVSDNTGTLPVVIRMQQQRLTRAVPVGELGLNTGIASNSNSNLSSEDNSTAARCNQKSLRTKFEPVTRRATQVTKYVSRVVRAQTLAPVLLRFSSPLAPLETSQSLKELSNHPQFLSLAVFILYYSNLLAFVVRATRKGPKLCSPVSPLVAMRNR